jgi:hypothetical protein
MGEFNNNGINQAAITKRSGIYITVGWVSAFLSLFIYPFTLRFGVIMVLMQIKTAANPLFLSL